MADTTFIDGDLSQANRIVAAWLNDVNNLRYGASNPARGAALLQYYAEDSGTTLRDTQSRLRERKSVKDYGAVGDGVTDDSAAFALAIASDRHIWVPPGTYAIDASVTKSSIANFVLEGAGVDVTIFKCSSSATFANIPLNFQSSTDIKVKGITFDSNANASLGSLAIVRFVSCNDFDFTDNRILHTYIGIGVDSCSRFRVQRNHIRKTAIATTLNYNINVSSTNSVSRYGLISDNLFFNSGSGIIGADIKVLNNVFSGNSYGAGIATFAQGAAGTTPGEFYGRYIISGNLCLNGTQRDVDGFMVAGMEIAGPYSVVTENIVATNAGEGIRLFAFESVVANNVIYGNGTGADGTWKQAGIVPFDATTIPGYNASYSLITGNRCFDNGGNTQTYGYYEQQSTLLGLQVKGNDFGNNFTGPFVLASSKTANYYEFDDPISYTPVMTSGTGTITTVGACTGAYLLKGRMCYFQAQCTITTNGGTAAGNIVITLPVTAAVASGYRFVLVGRGDAISGNSLVGVIASGGTSVVLTNYDGTYPGADGERIAVSGWYQI